MKTETITANENNSDLKSSCDLLIEKIGKALQTYANVHRGSGFKSMVTTHLYEKAREIILNYLHLSPAEYVVIFASGYRADKIKSQLYSDDFHLLKSSEFGLHLGVYALAVKKKKLPPDIRFIAGGGTTKLYSKKWIIHSGYPDAFEAGTPAIINCIAFAAALKMIEKSGEKGLFSNNLQPDSSTEIFGANETNSLKGFELLENLSTNMIGKKIQVPAIHGYRPFVNLDNSASTPAFSETWQVFAKTLSLGTDNEQKTIENARNTCAEVFNAPETEYEIIFSSNTTESINFVAECLENENENGIEPLVLITDLEHSSNDLPWRQMRGWQVNRLPFNKLGFWDLTQLEKTLDEYNEQQLFGQRRIKIVAVSGASNVLGSCNNLDETSRIVHKYSAKLLVDGAQLVAHREVNISKTNIDFFAFSGHKIYAPFGTGVLIAKKGFLTDEKKLAEFKKSGNENPGGIAAFARALQLLKQVGYETIVKHEEMLTRKTMKGLSQINDVRIFGIDNPASGDLKNKTGVIGFDIKNRAAGGIAKKLSFQAAIGTRYGCHCAHVLIKYLLDFTPFLEQFQRLVVLLVPPLKLQGFIRVSFGIETTETDIELLLAEVQKIASKAKTPGFKAIKEQTNEAILRISGEVYGD